MCRLLAYVADRDVPLAEVVGPPTLAAFRDLSRVHGDGWGAAWTSGVKGGAGRSDSSRSHGQGSVDVHRSTSSAAADPAFATVTEGVAARAGIVHLRWATEGLAVQAANTHPFVADGWAFAHNGFVSHVEALEALLPTRHRSRLQGTTDSERYFRLVLHCAEREGDLLAGVQRAAAQIQQIAGAVSINAVMLSPTRLLAVQGLSGATPPPADDLLAMVEHPDHLPVDHLDAYFHLAYRRLGGALIVASSGLPRDGWTTQPSDTVLDVDIASGREALHPLLPSSALTPLMAGAAANDPA